MVPTITLLANTADERFTEVLAIVRQVCHAVFDGPYHFEVQDRDVSATDDQHTGPVLIAEHNGFARRVSDCTDAETLILRLVDCKRAALRRSVFPGNGSIGERWQAWRRFMRSSFRHATGLRSCLDGETELARKRYC